MYLVIRGKLKFSECFYAILTAFLKFLEQIWGFSNN